MLYAKVCGITNVEDAQLAVEFGASAIGMVFWPESPRFVDPQRVLSGLVECSGGVAFFQGWWRIAVEWRSFSNCGM